MLGGDYIRLESDIDRNTQPDPEMRIVRNIEDKE